MHNMQKQRGHSYDSTETTIVRQTEISEAGRQKAPYQQNRPLVLWRYSLGFLYHHRPEGCNDRGARLMEGGSQRLI